MENLLKLNELREDAIELRLNVFCEEQGIARSEELTGDDILFDHFYLYIDDVLVSYARARRIDNYYLVGRVVTKKSYRNNGYSSKIFKFIEEMALNEGINTIKLHAQDVSLGYYLKLGFKITSEQYIEAGVEHHNVEKVLK